MNIQNNKISFKSGLTPNIRRIIKQAETLIPNDIDDEQKKYILDCVSNYTFVAGESISKEEDYTLYQKTIIVQFVGEWTFHKSIDLIRAKISDEDTRMAVLQKVAFVVFEVARQGIKRELSQEDLVNVIEHHVKKNYSESLKELYDNKNIDKAAYYNAMEQSNIDIMAEYVDSEEKHNEKEIYLKKMFILESIFVSIVFLFIGLFCKLFLWQKIIFYIASILMCLCNLPQFHKKLNFEIDKIPFLMNILIYFLLCFKKVKMAKCRVKLEYINLLRELTSKYDNKKDRINFLNRYKKKNKIININMVKVFYRNEVIPVARKATPSAATHTLLHFDFGLISNPSTKVSKSRNGTPSIKQQSPNISPFDLPLFILSVLV